MIDYLM